MSVATAGSGVHAADHGSNAASVQPTLKVMRLYKPRLYTQGATMGSTVPTALLPSHMQQHEFAMSSNLILPDSFGEIYLGNTFCSYISVINPYDCDLQNVQLTANIQCGSERTELRDNRYARSNKLPPENPMPVLEPGMNLDMIVDYPLAHVGNHVLRVGVTYTDPASKASKSMRKFYRFSVQNPLTFTFHKSTQSNGDEIVQACIRNGSKLPLFIDDIAFEPFVPFVSSMLAAKEEDSRDDMDLDRLLDESAQSLLDPQAELLRVFRVSQDKNQAVTTRSSQTSEQLGKLRVRWKTAMGEAGSMDSQPVLRNVPSSPLVWVEFEDMPKEVGLNSVFSSQVKVMNDLDRDVALQLQFRNGATDGIVCHSVSSLNLGTIASLSSTSVCVQFLAVEGGLQSITGIVCVDMTSGYEYYNDKSVQLMVRS